MTSAARVAISSASALFVAWQAYVIDACTPHNFATACLESMRARGWRICKSNGRLHVGRMKRSELADLAAFVAVADVLSFRAGAARLGITRSALSHAMQQLEKRLDV